MKLLSMLSHNMKAISLFIFLLVFTMPSFAWKPVTHVYLAKESVNEVETGFTIPFYRANYSDKTKGDLIDRYEADERLVNAIKNERHSFYAGVFGPDAYPDMPTGQGLIHVSCPELNEENNLDGGCAFSPHSVISSDWLEHIWDRANAEWNAAEANTPVGQNNPKDDVLAFAFGYLVHAAGDMFMHTFINDFAGGPFSYQSDNGVRHYLLEGYVEKKTPPLEADDYSLDMTEDVRAFIYNTLVNATVGSTLDEELMIKFNTSTIASVPRNFSSLRNALVSAVDQYDRDLMAYDVAIDPLFASLDECLDRAADDNLFNDCSVFELGDLSTRISLKVAEKSVYVLPRLASMEHARNWIRDINEGLNEWPKFSHKVAKSLFFNIEGKLNREQLADDWGVYYRDYFIKMLGGTNLASDVLNFKESIMEALYINDVKDRIKDWETFYRDQFLDIIISVISQGELDLEQFEAIVKSPELHFDAFLNKEDPSGLNPNARKVSLASYDQLLHLVGNSPSENYFDKNSFPVAHNTITMVKLMLLSEAGQKSLFNDLCNSGDCSHEPDGNPMLGFIRTLDGDNEWHNHSEKMYFAKNCGVYQSLFMLQEGDEGSVQPGCESQAAAKEPLTVPEMTPGGEFDFLPEITISHSESDVQIYYTINESDQIFEPSNNPADTRSRLYSNPFTLHAPFTEQRPFVIRAIAYKEGFLPSPSVEQEYLITVTQNTPIFFPTLTDHQGSVSVVLTADPGSTIFYTTNNTPPDTTSRRYSGSFQLGVGQHTVRAVAYQLGIPQSTVGVKQYRVWNGDGSANLAEPKLTPAFSVDAVDGLQMSMYSDDEGAEIRYTKVLSSVYVEPTQSSILYTGPFTLGIGDWFISAKAFDPSGSKGPSTSKPINITVTEAVGDVDTPVLEPPAGTYNNDLVVFVSGETTPNGPGSPVRYYKTDGTDPQALPYISPNYRSLTGIRLSKSSTVKVQASQRGYRPSPIASGRYDFVVADPVYTPVNGTFSESVEVTLETDTANAKVYYTLDGSEPTVDSMMYSAPIFLTQTSMIRSKGIRNGYSDSEVVSANFQINHPRLPVFITQPNAVEVFNGQGVTLNSLASGFPLPSYQWFKDDVPLQGETDKRFFIQNAQPGDAGDYKVVVTNSAGAIDSDTATVSVFTLPSLPTIITNPEPGDLETGDNLNLFVTAVSSSPDLSYQWYRDVTALSGKNSSQLSINNLAVGHAGEYWVRVSNAGGYVDSSRALVNVSEIAPQIRPVGYEFPPIIVSNPRSSIVDKGEDLHLSVITDAFPVPTFQWFHNQRPMRDQDQSTLSILDSGEEQAGEYFVAVRNSKGVIVSEVASVTVTEKLAVIEEENSNAEEINEEKSEAGVEPLPDDSLEKDESQENRDSEEDDDGGWFSSVNYLYWLPITMLLMLSRRRSTVSS